MIILAIDTSADETSVAVTADMRVLSSVVSSQIGSHKKWGGIMPTIAKLAHEKRIDVVCEKAISQAHLPNGAETLEAIAVTQGPGLSIALEVGIHKAKTLARSLKLPLYSVNHMEGHLYSPFVKNSKGKPKRKLEFPFLSLLISGGHTMIVNVLANGKYQILGETQDDAAGEALDKASKMLGMGYPGGSIIEKLSEEIDNTDKYHFPRPMMYDKSMDMSFSGLKTHFYYLLKGQKDDNVDILKDYRHLASSFQEAVFDVLCRKLHNAIDATGCKTIAVGGGVSANKYLRKRLRALTTKLDSTICFPPYKYLCGDNAGMIGVAGHMMILRGVPPSDIETFSRVPRLSL